MLIIFVMSFAVHLLLIDQEDLAVVLGIGGRCYDMRAPAMTTSSFSPGSIVTLDETRTQRPYSHQLVC
jgi:hypothetical protein